MIRVRNRGDFGVVCGEGSAYAFDISEEEGVAGGINGGVGFWEHLCWMGRKICMFKD